MWKYNSIINFGNLEVFAQFFDKAEETIKDYFNNGKEQMRMGILKNNKYDVDYDSIIKKITKAYKDAEKNMANELSRELGVAKTNEQVKGFSRAYSKTLFNYITILLYESMLENRGDLPSFNQEVDYVLEKLSESRPVPKEVLDNCIEKRDELKPDLERIFRADNTPESLSDALSEAEYIIDSYFN